MEPIQLLRLANRAYKRGDYLTVGELCDQAYELVLDLYTSELNEFRGITPLEPDKIPEYKSRLRSLVRTLESIRIAKIRVSLPKTFINQ